MTSGPDLSVEVNGLKLPNPFVIGSGPPGAQPLLLLPLPVDGPCHSCCAATAVAIVAATAAAAALLDRAVVSNGATPACSSCHAGTNYAVMKKAFEEGWGGVVAKTVSLDSCKVINVTPRCAAGSLQSSVYRHPPVSRPARGALCCLRRQRQAATAATWLLSRAACGSSRNRSIQGWRSGMLLPASSCSSPPLPASRQVCQDEVCGRQGGDWLGEHRAHLRQVRMAGGTSWLAAQLSSAEAGQDQRVRTAAGRLQELGCCPGAVPALRGAPTTACSLAPLPPGRWR